MSGPIKIPVGPARGKTIHECTVAELEDACTLVEARLCAARSEGVTAKHKRFVGAARPLLKLRKFPTGSYHTTELANLALRDAAEVGHLLAPSTQLAAVLPGTAIMITAFRVHVSTETFPDDEDETLRVPNKGMLDRVASALGVSWRDCQRTDPGRDPYIRSYTSTCAWREFDASERTKQGASGIDLTANSPLVKRLREKATHRDRVGFDVERMREHIDSVCDTQARLKAVRQMGVLARYSAKDLDKAFFAARVVFTAQTDDPLVKPVLAQAVVDAFAPARDALYGKRVAGGQR
ncbi:MAG TPA: hypothetical protein VJN18_32510 [Polyangiaceae bacterium]|nr:hypothetical protein [Polyangiaceae bacterium]